VKKLLASAVVAASMFAGIGVAIASADPGPDKVNDHNQHGQCTAFFNGQKKGQEGLAGQDLQDFYDSCRGMISGNPAENGRYADCFTDTNNDPSDDCSDG
jgi:hypothetical protein